MPAPTLGERTWQRHAIGFDSHSERPSGPPIRPCDTHRNRNLERLQPVGDPWLNSWEDGDPLRDQSIAVLEAVPGYTQSQAAKTLAAELLTLFDR